MAILIKRYANRKLYNTEASRYITLKGISELVREGREIRPDLVQSLIRQPTQPQPPPQAPPFSGEGHRLGDE